MNEAGNDVGFDDGMKPWTGGDGPPADWDGGDVLMSDMSQSMGYYLEPGDWKHGSGDDIIAYRPIAVLEQGRVG